MDLSPEAIRQAWIESERYSREANARHDARVRRTKLDQSIREFGLFYLDGRTLVHVQGPDLARTGNRNGT